MLGRIEKRPCQACNKDFIVKRPWQIFCGKSCKDGWRSAIIEVGERFRTNEPAFREVLALLEKGVASLIVGEMATDETIAYLTRAHSLLSERLAVVEAPLPILVKTVMDGDSETRDIVKNERQEIGHLE